MRARPVLFLVLSGCPFFDGGDDTDTVGVGTVDYGGECAASSDCLSVYVCSGMGTCAVIGEPGTATEGDSCLSSSFCGQGLACNAVGECATAGSAGTLGQGETCAATEDCRLGYACVQDACYGFDLPVWLGAECPETEEGPFRVLFDVPADLSAPTGDFYRLPFPNDARVVDGTMSLAGHPGPGPLIPALGDVVGDVLAGVAQDFVGFGTNQSVLLRFSARADFDTISLGMPEEGDTVALIGLTPGSPDYGRPMSVSMRSDSGRGAYICANWTAVTPSRPLRPAETYALLVTTGVLANADGAPAVPDADFAALLAPAAPSDPGLASAWDAYAPLRAWLDETARDPGLLAGGAVFTTQDPREPAKQLRAAVVAEPTPIEEGIVVCGDDPGPYADAEDPSRGCHGVSDAYFEIQGAMPLPQFQAGLPPFKDRADGGNIDIAGGPPEALRTDAVHFVLTVPKGTMPAEGWPVVVYGHGTGGNYRSAVDEGLADQLSAVTLDDGGTVAFATITIDALHHGPRRHAENWKPAWLEVDPDAYEPDALFYNPLNPRAARDNSLQSSADAWSVAKWTAALRWTSDASPTGQEVKFNPAHTYYMGHSQGATSGSLTVAYAPEFRAAVLSAAGGLLIESLLNKVSPRDISAMIKVGLADPNLSRVHPLMNIAQMAGERSDGINHAKYVLREPFDSATSVLQLAGVGDTYTPDECQFPLAKELGLAQDAGEQAPRDGLTAIAPPVSGNAANGTTGVVALYGAANGKDAHYVLFERDDAMRQAVQFLATAVVDGRPTHVSPTP